MPANFEEEKKNQSFNEFKDPLKKKKEKLDKSSVI